MNACHHKIISNSLKYKKFSSIFTAILILLLSIPDICIAGDITISGGTAYVGFMPTYPYFSFSLTQIIYLQSELNPGSEISIDQVGFYYSGSATSRNVVVYMGNTSKSTFASTTDWVSTSNMTQVFSGSYSLSSTTGWYYITLSTPFTYNNSDNLVICVDDNTGSYSLYDTDDFYHRSEGANRSIYYYSDTYNYSPSSPPTGALYTYRPHLYLHYTLSLPVAGAGDCLNFDGLAGTDYVRVLHASELAPSSYVSLEFWGYDDNWTTTGSAEEGMVTKTQSGGYGIWRDASNIHAYVWRNSSYSTNATYAASSLSAGWHHFALTYDGRYTRLYIDGTLEDTDDAGGSYSITYSYSNALIIGGEAYTGTTPADYFEGRLDEVRIWNDERTQSEIEDNMYYALSSSESNLVGNWHFDEGSGSTLTDYSGDGNNGTLVTMESADWVASEAWKNRTTLMTTHPLPFARVMIRTIIL